MNKKLAFAALALLALVFALAAGVAEEGSALQVGDYFTFGVYEQDNVLDNGMEPIEWRVLAIEGNEILAISQYALDSQPYNDKGGYARWVKASLRTWLSTEFYNTAFNDEEKACIITKDLKNWKEANTSDDPVTLIDCDEAKKLFANHDDRQCTPTAYCIAQGARLSTKYNRTKDGPMNVNWWLRQHSWESNYRGAYVAMSGGVMTCGGNKDGTASNAKIAVRPAIYLNADMLGK
ncbi:MAG: hypothetical protein IJD60_10240 [Clostridia bacterium]|nr:hypothetical protein [Clostridia bacterium]